jgi:hypothetical protein
MMVPTKRYYFIYDNSIRFDLKKIFIIFKQINEMRDLIIIKNETSFNLYSFIYLFKKTKKLKN